MSFLPLLIVLILGYITHRILLSLTCGIIIAAYIAADNQIVPTVSMTANAFWNNISSLGNITICTFLLCLGVIVNIMRHTGGSRAYGDYAQRKIKDNKNAETASLILSTKLFIDDYLSCLTVGSVMSPIADRYKIPRVKLAFLVDSFAAPLAILCPFSSWVAAIVGFLNENGINDRVNEYTVVVANPFITYLHVIPYIFYSLVLFVTVWFIVRCRISFGLMHKHEQSELQRDEVLEQELSSFPIESNKHSLYDFFGPVFLLLASVILSLLYYGGWTFFGGPNNALTAMQNTQASTSLFTAGLLVLTICTPYYILNSKIKFKKMLKVYGEGALMMLSAVGILLLAWTLGDLIRHELHAGYYLAQILTGNVSITLLPMMIFFASALIAFTIGSAWGTAAIMFPIVIPLVLQMLGSPTHPAMSEIGLLLPALGAVLSGCVAGDHISPISDTTIMACSSTGAELIEHVKTQLPMSIPVVIGTGVGFYVSALLVNKGILLTVILPIIIALLISTISLTILNCKNK